MPQKPRFLRKMMGFDGGGLVLTSATLRCTNKPHGDYAVGFCLAQVFQPLRNETTVNRKANRTLREKEVCVCVIYNGLPPPISSFCAFL